MYALPFEFVNENGIKIIQFESTFKKHGDLKIRLHYDELKSRDFFNAIVEGYINRDERIINDPIQAHKNHFLSVKNLNINYIIL